MERRRSEEALRESEQRFSALFNQVTTGIAQTDLTGRFVLVNQRYCDIVGRASDELLQLRMQDITHPDGLPGNPAQFQQLMTEGSSFEIEKRYIRPDGSVVWVANSVSMVQDAEVRPKYIVALTQDITARKQAEEALQEIERRFTEVVGVAELSSNFRTLFEAAPTPFLAVTPPDFVVIAVNDAYLRATMTEREASSDEVFSMFFPTIPPTARPPEHATCAPPYSAC